jgi:hypothetical protein
LIGSPLIVPLDAIESSTLPFGRNASASMFWFEMSSSGKSTEPSSQSPALPGTSSRDTTSWSWNGIPSMISSSTVETRKALAGDEAARSPTARARTTTKLRMGVVFLRSTRALRVVETRKSGIEGSLGRYQFCSARGANVSRLSDPTAAPRARRAGLESRERGEP